MKVVVAVGDAAGTEQAEKCGQTHGDNCIYKSLCD